MSDGSTFFTDAYVDAQSDLKIIGWGNIRDRIVLFTTNSDEKNPSSVGQIWMFEYNDNNNSIKYIDSNGFLKPSAHLKYNNKTNFSSYHPIMNEVIGRYENSDIGRVYWTDNYNPLRSLNLFNEDTLIIEPSLLNVQANTQLTMPIIKKVKTGGSLPVGSSVQCAYRYRNDDEGSETTISPVTPLVHLTEFDPNSDSYQDYGGSPDDVGTGKKAVEYNIPFVDTRYDVIEHFIILYEDNNNPQIYKYDEEFIGTTSDSIIKTVSEIPNDAVRFTLEEFNFINSSFNITKSITAKDNRLIAGNNKTKSLEINWDSRVYRFNSNQEAKLYKIDQDLYTPGTPADKIIDGTSPNWDNIPEDHDAINPYNHDPMIWDYSVNGFHSPLTNDNYCQYQSDGTTLGGEGPNISYEFVSQDLVGEETNNITDTPFISVGKYSNKELNLGVKDHEGDDIIHDVSDEFKNLKSPILETLLTGYTRGEIYRFGIVFYDISGNPTYVNWIGDIRFPFNIEGNHFFPIGTDETYSVSNNLDGKSVHSLGVKFNVDISSIKEEISGYSIVRLPRTEDDKSRIETGIMGPLYYTDSNVATTGWEDKINSEISGITDNGNQAYILDAYSAGLGDNETARSGDWNPACIYMGGVGEFSHLDIQGADYVEKIAEARDDTEFGAGTGVKKGITWKEIYNTPNSAAYWARVASINTGVSSVKKHRAKYRIDLNKVSILGAGDAEDDFDGTYPLLNGIWTQPFFSNDSIDGGEADGIGDRNTFLRLYDNPKDFFDLVDSGSLVYVTIGNNRNKAFAQYGGDSYEDRSNQRYISTGHYQIVTDQVPSKINFQVYGGDTYTFYYDKQVCYKNVEGTQDADYDEGRPKITQGVMFTLETSTNTELRHKNQNYDNFAKDGSTSSFGSNTEHSSNKGFNNAYRQKNNVRRSYRTLDVFNNTVEEHSHQIWASDSKIDGELVDSWRFFRPAVNIEVEGIYGPINKVINFRDIVYFYQDNALGAVSINERSTLTSDQGTSLTLGFGGVLDDFRYISTESGTVHQYSVVESGAAMYYFDASNKKFMRFASNGNQPLSDIKGLSAFFGKKIEGRIEHTEKPITEYIEDPQGEELKIGGIGIHGIYDRRHNRVLFTFLGGKYDEILGLDPSGGTFVQDYEWNPDRFTLSFSENTNNFESFYDFTPNLYIDNDHRVFSVDPNNLGHGYEHDVGDYSTYYDTTYRSSVKFLINESFAQPKIFNNSEFNLEVFDTNDEDVWDDNIDRIRLSNNYQDSGEVPLVINNNTKRRFRKWRLTLPRHNDKNSLTYDPSEESNRRMRGPWCYMELIYDNDNNYRLVLHDVETYFKVKPY